MSRGVQPHPTRLINEGAAGMIRPDATPALDRGYDPVLLIDDEYVLIRGHEHDAALRQPAHGFDI